jgi:tetraacyldisaccharide 4'-kinase
MRFNIESLWYDQHPLRWFLRPLSWIYQGAVSLRRFYLQAFRQQQFPIPVIIVGNLTVGGVGKTPLVIALVKAFQQKGLRVGVVSRGYKATIKKFPHEVSRNDAAEHVGDEPLLIARKCACPVVIAPKRTQAVRYLLEKCQSQIIISDDGLQHYAMGRAIEIVVIDGVRGFGNNLCLPAGPMRENSHRLKSADMLVVNSGEWPNAYPMTLIPGKLTQLDGGETVEQKCLSKPIAAVAAIGNPERFFSTLSALGMVFYPYAFPDHYQFTAKAMKFDEKTVVMTEKDAVKCQSFAAKNWYFLPVEAQLSDAFWSALWSHKRLKGYL